jgi:hypothetical protein
MARFVLYIVMSLNQNAHLTAFIEAHASETKSWSCHVAELFAEPLALKKGAI